MAPCVSLIGAGGLAQGWGSENDIPCAAGVHVAVTPRNNQYSAPPNHASRTAMRSTLSRYASGVTPAVLCRDLRPLRACAPAVRGIPYDTRRRCAASALSPLTPHDAHGRALARSRSGARRPPRVDRRLKRRRAVPSLGKASRCRPHRRRLRPQNLRGAVLRGPGCRCARCRSTSGPAPG